MSFFLLIILFLHNFINLSYQNCTVVLDEKFTKINVSAVQIEFTRPHQIHGEMRKIRIVLLDKTLKTCFGLYYLNRIDIKETSVLDNLVIYPNLCDDVPVNTNFTFYGNTTHFNITVFPEANVTDVTLVTGTVEIGLADGWCGIREYPVNKSAAIPDLEVTKQPNKWIFNVTLPPEVKDEHVYKVECWTKTSLGNCIYQWHFLCVDSEAFHVNNYDVENLTNCLENVTLNATCNQTLELYIQPNVNRLTNLVNIIIYNITTTIHPTTAPQTKPTTPGTKPQTKPTTPGTKPQTKPTTPGTKPQPKPTTPGTKPQPTTQSSLHSTQQSSYSPPQPTNRPPQPPSNDSSTYQAYVTTCVAVNEYGWGHQKSNTIPPENQYKPPPLDTIQLIYIPKKQTINFTVNYKGAELYGKVYQVICWLTIASGKCFVAFTFQCLVCVAYSPGSKDQRDLRRCGEKLTFNITNSTSTHIQHSYPAISLPTKTTLVLSCVPVNSWGWGPISNASTFIPPPKDHSNTDGSFNMYYLLFLLLLIPLVVFIMCNIITFLANYKEFKYWTKRVNS